MPLEELVRQGQEELQNFYAPYFESANDLEDFLFDALNYEKGTIARRQMLYQVQRFVSLANDIDKVRPARDSLRMMFVKICLESLCSLSNYKGKRKNIFYQKFVEGFSVEGSTYILTNFSLTSFEDEWDGHVFKACHKLDMNDFFEIIKTVRDKVVHEGEYWEMQFFAYDEDSTWLTSLETPENLLPSYKYQRKAKKNTVYHFATTLKYDRFIYYFTEACVRYISSFTEAL